MKTIQATIHKARGAMAGVRGVLLLTLMAGVLLAACGGSPKTAPQAAATPAASQGVATTPTSAGKDQSNTAGQGGQQGDSEFGLPEAEVVKRVDAVEAFIATCMRDAGFEYVPVDYATVRKAMDSNSKPSGMKADEFRAQFGYGITTQFIGVNSQAAMGAGEQNIRIRNGLSPADRTAYDHALYGNNPSATFVVGLDSEDFSPTGGCTRSAVEQVFSPEELGPGFVNYQNARDSRVDQDPRVIAAEKDWASCMRQAGYSYGNSNDIKTDLANRFHTITGGAASEALSADAQTALKQLQGEELAIVAADHKCNVEFVDPIKKKVATELLGPAAANQ